MLPHDLSSLIKISKEAVDTHPQHQLNLGYRWALYSAMETTQHNIVNVEDKLGHKRRTYLAIKTAQLVLPFWNEGPLRLPPDNLIRFYNEISGIIWNEERYQPAHLLQMANEIMLGTRLATTEDLMYAEATFSYYEYYEYYYQERQDLRYLYAGICAAQAYLVSVKDEIFDRQINLLLTEMDLEDPTYKTEASFFGSMIYAGGSIWNSHSNNNKRHEFWMWWLLEAIPEAWIAFN